MSTQTEIVSLEMGLDKEDVLAIGVTQAEEYAQSELDRCREEAEHLRDSAQRQHLKVQEMLQAHTAAHFKKKLDAFHAVAKAAGMTEIDTRPGTGLVQIDNGKYWASASLLARNPNKTREGSLSVSLGEKIKVPAAILALEKQSDADADAAKKLEAEAIEWKKRLSNIPRLERKLRGKLAAQRLNQTAEGKAIVNLLSADIRSEVLALPHK